MLTSAVKRVFETRALPYLMGPMANKGETAVHGCHCLGDMVLRMCMCALALSLSFTLNKFVFVYRTGIGGS